MSEVRETLEEKVVGEADLDGGIEAAEPVDRAGDADTDVAEASDGADDLIAILDDEPGDEPAEADAASEAVGEEAAAADGDGDSEPSDVISEETASPEQEEDADPEGTEAAEDAAGETEALAAADAPDEDDTSRFPRRRRRFPAAAVVTPVVVMSLLAGAGVALSLHGLPRAEPVALAEAAVAEAADWPRPAAGPEPSEEMAARLDRERMTEAQEEVVEAAREMGAAGPSMCLMWVNDVYEASGHDFERLWAASEACQMWCHSTDEEDLRPGMIVAVESTDTSPLAGHIGIYLGDGQIASNETWGGEGVIRTRDVDDWIAMFGKVDRVRWGWPEDKDLSKETDEGQGEDEEKDGDGENGNERHGEEDAEGEGKESEGQGEEENGER